MLPRDEWRGRHETRELIKLFMAIAVIKDHLRTEGVSASERAVVETLLDDDKRRKLLPAKAADALEALLAETGNKDRGSPRSLKSRERYLRRIMCDARTAVQAVASGRANDFQFQFVTEVLPMIFILRADAIGQTDSQNQGPK